MGEQRWSVLWRSSNRLDGETRRVMWNAGNPLLFRTRAQALAYIKDRYGYIARRADLRREPHGWRMPLPVRVAVDIHIAPTPQRATTSGES